MFSSVIIVNFERILTDFTRVYQFTWMNNKISCANFTFDPFDKHYWPVVCCCFKVFRQARVKAISSSWSFILEHQGKKSSTKPYFIDMTLRHVWFNANWVGEGYFYPPPPPPEAVTLAFCKSCNPGILQHLVKFYLRHRCQTWYP